MTEQEVLAMAFFRLSALREAIAGLTHRVDIEERFVAEFHGTLDLLDGAGLETSGFRLGDADLQHRIESAVPAEGEYEYSDKRYASRALLLAKLDAAVAYFKWKRTEPPPALSYEGPPR